MTLAMTPAAVCQCFTLVSLCTSIADPNWIQIQNRSDANNKLMYGVAFTLHAYQNRTDTGPLGGLNGWGMWLLYLLTALCYSAVLLSSSSFLLDFLKAAVSQSRLITTLHVSTALNCVAVLVVCVACVCVIKHNLQRGKHVSLLNHTEGNPELSVSPGESLYIQILGLIFSVLACVSALRPQAQPIRLHAEGADSDTEPLIGGAEE